MRNVGIILSVLLKAKSDVTSMSWLGYRQRSRYVRLTYRLFKYQPLHQLSDSKFIYFYFISPSGQLADIDFRSGRDHFLQMLPDSSFANRRNF
jgi:hypothetical protein